MLHKLFTGVPALPIKYALGALLMSIALSSEAACNDAGGTCPVDDAPAVQQPNGVPDAGVGNPINVITGNKYQKEVDLPALPGVLGLEIVRHYNSSLSGPRALPGPVGRGWRLSYETELAILGNSIEVIQADGSKVIFGRDLANPMMARHFDAARGAISISPSARGDQYTWTWNDGRKLSFNSKGKLVQIQAATGEILSLQHDARGLLVRVTDPQGRSLSLSWLSQAQARGADRFRGVQHIDTPVGRFAYGYGSALPKGSSVDPRILLSNLATVIYPASEGASRSRRYHYEDALHPTLLTGVSVESVNSAGKAASVRYASYAYRDDARAVLSTHAGNANKVTLDFAVPGQTTLTNSLGQKTVYRYETIGDENRLLEVRGAGCSTCSVNNMRYAYDKQGRLTEQTVITPAGLALSGTRRELDAQGRPKSVSQVAYVAGKAAAPQWQLRYEYSHDGASAPVLVERPSVISGKVVATTIRYNSAGQLLSVSWRGWTGGETATSEPTPIVRTTGYAYRVVNGRSVLAQIDGPAPNGKQASPADSDITRFDYDATGSMLVRIHAPGNIVSEVTARDAAQRIAASHTSDGVRLVDSSTVYDYRGMPLTTTQRAKFVAEAAKGSLSRTTRFAYDAFGRMASVTKPDRTTLHTVFDAAGRPAALVGPKGQRIDRSFDSEGRMLASLARDAGGEILGGTLNLWDENNRVRASFNPLTLDQARSPMKLAGGMVTFDGNGEASASVASGGRTDILAADHSTRRIATGRDGMLFTDGARRTHAIRVDDFGRVVAELAPDEGTFAYTFGERVLEKRHTGNGGAQTMLERLEFSSSGRLAQRTIAGCTQKFSYQGDLLVRLDGCGSSHRYVRDAFGLILEHHQTMTREGSKEELSFVSRYTYHPQTGQLTERRLPDGQRLSYRYDSTDASGKAVMRDAGWLAWVDHYLGESTAGALRGMLPASMTDEAVLADVKWRPFGGAASITSGNGVTAHSSFDKAGRLRSLDVVPAGQAPLETLRYGYDGAGALVASSRNASNVRYQYDALRRLTGETTVAAAGTAPVAASPAASLFAASYDPRGRRTGLSARPDYDAFGRQVVRGKQQLGYDDAHRLVSVTENGKQIAHYRYDALGNRIAKTVGAVTTYFLYDTARHLVAEIDAGGRIATQYLYVEQNPVAMMRAEGSSRTRALYAIHADHRGLPVALTDTSGKPVWRGAFDAFGNERPAAPNRIAQAGGDFELISSAQAAAPAFAMPLRMAGQYADQETGLYYNVYRYYDPQQGRYITPDPTGLAGGENSYQYAASDPMSKIDPLGLFEIPKTFIAKDPFQLTPIIGSPWWDIPAFDHGHGDILRVAFNQYQRANGARFSQHTIEWIIRNVYHTDANGPNCLVIPLPATPGSYIGAPYTEGGGQCNAKAHFDNPNDGPVYKEAVNLDSMDLFSKRHNGYKDGKDDFWIADTVAFLDNNRNSYNKVVGKDISWSLSAFGQNMHSMADFYAHSNWVDQQSRGGAVKTEYEIFENNRVVKRTECGWIPPGLNMSRLWNGGTDDINYAYLYTGTVAGPGQTANRVCGRAHNSAVNYGDIHCTEDETTHGYWNKDHAGLTPGETAYTTDEIIAHRKKGLYSWSLATYSPTNKPAGTFGVDWYGDFGVTAANLKAGDTVYIRGNIEDRHQMAMTLAMLDTQREIAKLFDNSANVKIGGLSLADVFKMDRDQKENNGILYAGKHSKL